MSISAYRIKQIKVESDSSFNLWHNEHFIEYMKEIDDNYNETRVRGQIKISVKAAKKAVKEYNFIKFNCEDIKEKLIKDIRNEERKGNEFIEYICF